jgi:YVTN family beta-propeller protein
MYNNKSCNKRASMTRGFLALCAVLAIWLGALASTAEAQPFAYVANGSSNTVSVIDTATNTVTATVAVGAAPFAVAVTPDGTHAYVANSASNNVSVIATATNTVTATVAVGSGPIGVGIIPPSTTVPFLAFSAQLQIAFGRAPNQDAFALESSFTLSSTAPAINPVTQPVALQVGTFSTTIPPGSFKKTGQLFTFAGVVNGVSLQALVTPTGTLRYAFAASAQRASLTGTTNPVPVTLTIGGNSGTTSVKAIILH